MTRHSPAQVPMSTVPDFVRTSTRVASSTRIARSPSRPAPRRARRGARSCPTTVPIVTSVPGAHRTSIVPADGARRMCSVPSSWRSIVPPSTESAARLAVDHADVAAAGRDVQQATGRASACAAYASPSSDAAPSGSGRACASARCCTARVERDEEQPRAVRLRGRDLGRLHDDHARRTRDPWRGGPTTRRAGGRARPRPARRARRRDPRSRARSSSTRASAAMTATVANSLASASACSATCGDEIGRPRTRCRSGGSPSARTDRDGATPGAATASSRFASARNAPGRR